MGAEKLRREVVHPSFLSSYRSFWRGCEWQLFLPVKGLSAAKEDPQIRESIKQLQANPGAETRRLPTLLAQAHGGLQQTLRPLYELQVSTSSP